LLTDPIMPSNRVWTGAITETVFAPKSQFTTYK
jgi:hypothetical protein